MRIEKLDIKGFGRFSEKQLNFTDGLNVLYGPNESGKSTLQLFIKAMLYGLKGGRATREGIPSQLNRLKPWEGRTYSGVMEYTLQDGRKYRVERDFDRGTTVIYDGSYNDISGEFPISKDKQPMFADKHTGMPEDCFEKTIFIRQLETRLDGENSGSLLVRLANISQTGYEDMSFKKAEEALKEAVKDVLGTGRNGSRPGDVVEARLKELRTARQAAAERQSAGMENNSKLLQLHRLREHKQQEKDFLSGAGVLIELRKRLDERKNTIKTLRMLSSELLEIQGDIEAADLELRAVREGALNGVRSRAAQKLQRKRKSFTLWYFLISVGVILLSALTVSSFPFLYDRMEGLLPGAAGRYLLVPAVILILAVLLRPLAVRLYDARSGNTVGSVQLKTDLKPQQGSAAAGHGVDSVDRLASLNARAMERYSAASLACGKVLDNMQTLEDECAAAQKDVISLERSLDKGIEELTARFAGCGIDVPFFDTGSIGHSLTEGDSLWLEEAWRHSTEEVNGQLAEYSLDIRECETLNRNGGDDDELQRLDEEIDVLLKTKLEYEGKGAALSLALSNLQAAADDIRKSFSPSLDMKMCGIISRMTGDRYNTVKADDGLRLMTVTPGNGTIRNASILSGGTTDQFYLALRLAAAELLEPKDEKLPFILDEVFSQYDDDRTRMTLEYLKEICSERQVILLSCKKRELELAAEVFGEACTLHILD
jgi:DNA repair exonuclease SbcCD ATPase subunit